MSKKISARKAEFFWLKNEPAKSENIDKLGIFVK